MKPHGMLCRMMIAALMGGLPCGLAAAGAGDAAPEGRIVLAQVEHEAKSAGPETAAALVIWEGQETELLKVLSAAITDSKNYHKSDTTTDWKALEVSVKGILFSYASAESEIVWPETQLKWVDAARKALNKEEKYNKNTFAKEQELEIVNSIYNKLKEDVGATNQASETKAQEDSEADRDENVWKFRDKSGARTTKARYKGQEPVN